MQEKKRRFEFSPCIKVRSVKYNIVTYIHHMRRHQTIGPQMPDRYIPRDKSDPVPMVSMSHL